MGKRASSLERASYDDHRSEASPETVRELGASIDALRDDLGGLVAELDRRRHELLDVKLQARRHAVGIAAGSVSLAGAATAMVWLAMWRARKRRTLGARANRLGEAISRMVDRPERVAAEQTVLGKILTTAATAAVATTINRLLGPALQGFVEEYRRSGRAVARRALSVSAIVSDDRRDLEGSHM